MECYRELLKGVNDYLFKNMFGYKITKGWFIASHDF